MLLQEANRSRCLSRAKIPDSLIPYRYKNEKEAFENREETGRRLGPILDRVVRKRRPQSFKSDPVSFVHRFYSIEDIEIAGIVASALAYGNVKSISVSVERLFSILGPRPADRIDALKGKALVGELSNFVHRFNRGEDLAALLYAARTIQIEYGEMGRCFADCLNRAEGDLRKALYFFVSKFRTVDFSPLFGHNSLPDGFKYLLHDGTGPGACKRMHMFLRWMVRGPDGVDLGVWKKISPSILLMPLDTHTGRICRYLGLTSRKEISWRVAEEITWHLAGIDPLDPVRYDFALAHLGISKACTHRRNDLTCNACPLLEACSIE